MNIKILDSWLRVYLRTKAKPEDLAKALSLTSVSVEKIEPLGNDFVYDIEVTTNRVDLMSVIGIAREAAAVLPQFNINASFEAPKFNLPKIKEKTAKITIKNDPALTYRICAVVMDVKLGNSPAWMKKRLEASSIRSLNNVIDVTNYVMREIGHPAHVFDYDRLREKTIIIRASQKGEKIITLDKKEHTLLGGDIVADDGTGQIIDLLGIMGTANSVVTNNTRRILFFLDNNDPIKIRRTSMSLGIRTDAATLNEKAIDPELAYQALLRGIELYQEIAGGRIISDIIDIYPQKPKNKKLTVTGEKINSVIGVPIPLEKAGSILSLLGFGVISSDNKLTVSIPCERLSDIDIEEDLIEEIARIYGYHNLPSVLPPATQLTPFHLSRNEFYWEQRVKEALKYWGFIETYTYSLVSEEMFEGPTDEAVTLYNPLNSELTYMRRTLTPSLLQVIRENKAATDIKIFEIANVYLKKENTLPDEIRILAGVVKSKNSSFFSIKGYIEQLANDLGISELLWKPSQTGDGGEVYIGPQYLGNVEILDQQIITFELKFQTLIDNATLRKIYKGIAKYPPLIEDMAFVANQNISTGEIIEEIKEQSKLLVEVTLLDSYQNSRTFHLHYQDKEKNLSNEDVTPIRNKIIQVLQTKFQARLKI